MTSNKARACFVLAALILAARQAAAQQLLAGEKAAGAMTIYTIPMPAEGFKGRPK
jgi:hypothetical protein